MCSRINRFISEEEYVSRYMRQAVPYEGFIVGKGYAYYYYNAIFPTTAAQNGAMFWDRYTPTFFVQRVDSSDYMKERSLNITPDDISNLLAHMNPDGTTTVNVGIGKNITLSKQNGAYNVWLEDNGSEIMVYIEVKDTRVELGKTIEIIEKNSCRLKDFYTVFEPVDDYSPSALDISKIAVGELSIMVGATDFWWKKLPEQAKNKIVQDVLNNYGWKTKQDIREIIPVKMKTAGRWVGGAGAAVSLWSAASDNRLTWGEVADIGVAVTVAFMSGPAGWIVGGLYFVGDIVLKEITGYSISESIDNLIGEKALITDDILGTIGNFIKGIYNESVDFIEGIYDSIENRLYDIGKNIHDLDKRIYDQIIIFMY
jgi:hypothetical protein